jgi:hypothetical protein
MFSGGTKIQELNFIAFLNEHKFIFWTLKLCYVFTVLRRNK